MEFRGTVTITPKSYVAFVRDILECFARHGYERIVIINGHGGNIGGLTTAVQDFHREHEAKVFVFSWWMLKGVEFPDTVTDYHAGDSETSVALALGIDLRGEPVDEMKYIPSGLRIRKMTDVTASGVMGYPSKASKEKGEKILGLVVDHIVDAVGEVPER